MTHRLAVTLRRLAAEVSGRFWDRLDARIDHLMRLAALGELPPVPPAEPEPLSPAAVAEAYRLLQPVRRT